MREVEPQNVRARGDQAGDRLGVRGRGPERCDDLRPTHSARLLAGAPGKVGANSAILFRPLGEIIPLSGNIKPSTCSTICGSRQEGVLERDEVREDVLEDARRHVREMVLRGMTADEVESSFEDELSETERDLVWVLARHEIDRGRSWVLGQTAPLIRPPG